MVGVSVCVCNVREEKGRKEGRPQGRSDPRSRKHMKIRNGGKLLQYRFNTFRQGEREALKICCGHTGIVALCSLDGYAFLFYKDNTRKNLKAFFHHLIHALYRSQYIVRTCEVFCANMTTGVTQVEGRERGGENLEGNEVTNENRFLILLLL